MLSIILGIILIVLAFLFVTLGFIRTPQNLRGYYSVTYWLIAGVAIIGGSLLIIL